MVVSSEDITPPPKVNSKAEEMIEKFVCPGCMLGSDTKCGSYEPRGDGTFTCGKHAPGTNLFTLRGVQTVVLGLPLGFCRVMTSEPRTEVRCWAAGTNPGWNPLNVPVWAKEEDGHLFVRTYCPRIDTAYVDVIEGGTKALVPQALDPSDLDID